jgi:hypothetical protein
MTIILDSVLGSNFLSVSHRIGRTLQVLVTPEALESWTAGVHILVLTITDLWLWTSYLSSLSCKLLISEIERKQYFTLLLWSPKKSQLLSHCSSCIHFVFISKMLKEKVALKIKILWSWKALCNEENLLEFKQLTCVRVWLELKISNINTNFNINNYNSRYKVRAKF